jgi:hypothetical protein
MKGQGLSLLHMQQKKYSSVTVIDKSAEVLLVVRPCTVRGYTFEYSFELDFATDHWRIVLRLSRLHHHVTYWFRLHNNNNNNNNKVETVKEAR